MKSIDPHTGVIRSSRWKKIGGDLVTGLIGLMLALPAISVTAYAQVQNGPQDPGAEAPGPQGRSVILPLVQCFYKGKVAYYIQTEASDLALAKQQEVNYVPQLSKAIATGAVDDIYHITNFTQGNVIPSAPTPAGPANTDPNYSPLWQLSTVTWNPGITPHVLTSEAEILDAQSSGLVTLVKTNIVINCPVIYTPFGGLLPYARILGGPGIGIGGPARPDGPR